MSQPCAVEFSPYQPISQRTTAMSSTQIHLSTTSSGGQIPGYVSDALTARSSNAMVSPPTKSPSASQAVQLPTHNHHTDAAFR
ncbi:hypothetical protein BDW74DRAFT_4501 [Aspergillus multicolor]|uniref:uncharacterized protein n=1 Tax=Aspergillus multicolor TaxID=41759 RepID=UPI003CCD0015